MINSIELIMHVIWKARAVMAEKEKNMNGYHVYRKFIYTHRYGSKNSKYHYQKFNRKTLCAFFLF